MEYTTYAVTAINTPAAYTPHCTSQRLRRVWGHSTGRIPCCVSYQNTSEGSIQGRQARRAMASHHPQVKKVPVSRWRETWNPRISV